MSDSSQLGPSTAQGETTEPADVQGEGTPAATISPPPRSSQSTPEAALDAADEPRGHESRRLTLSGLPTPTKALVLAALLVMSAGFLVGLLQGVRQPEIQTTLGTLPIRMSVPALVLVLLSFGLAWCVSVTAAIAAPLPVRLLIVGAFSLAMLDQGTLFSHLLLVSYGLPLLGALVVLWVWVEGSAWRRRRASSAAVRERLSGSWLSAMVTLLLVAGIQSLAYFSAGRAQSAGVFAVGFVLSLTVFAYVATIRLSYSGADFAEIGDAVSSWLARRSRRKLATVFVALGVLAYALRQSSSIAAVSGGCVLLVLATATVVLFARRSAPTTTTSLPWWAPVLAGVLLQGAIIGAVAISFSPRSTAHTPSIAEANAATRTSPVQCPEAEEPWCAPTAVYHDSRPLFSIAYPPGWVPLAAPSGAFISAGYTQPWPGAMLIISSYTPSQLGVGLPDATRAWARAAVERAEQQFLAGAARVAVTGVHGTQIEFTLTGEYTPASGVGEAHYVDGRVWVIRGVSADDIWRQYRPQAEFMLSTWRPDRSAQPAAPAPVPRRSGSNTDSAAGYFSAICLAIFALLAAVLLVHRMSSAHLRAACLLLLASTLLAGLGNLNMLIALLTGRTEPNVPHITFPAMQATLAVVVLALLLAPSRGANAVARLRRDMLAPATILLGSVLLLGLVFDRFADLAGNGGALTGTEVAFLLGAFLWDVLMSGAVTNRDDWLSRQARVLLYFAFALGSSGAVLYYAYGRELGSAANKDAFSPEADTAFSIAFIGVACALLIFVKRTAGTQGGPDR